MFFQSSALSEHMRECLEARREANRRIDSLAQKMEEGFGEARRKIDERHEANQASFSRLYSGLWKVALAMLGAFAMNYLAQHGLTAPGFVH